MLLRGGGRDPPGARLPTCRAGCPLLGAGPRRRGPAARRLLCPRPRRAPRPWPAPGPSSCPCGGEAGQCHGGARGQRRAEGVPGVQGRRPSPTLPCRGGTWPPAPRRGHTPPLHHSVLHCTTPYYTARSHAALHGAALRAGSGARCTRALHGAGPAPRPGRSVGPTCGRARPGRLLPSLLPPCASGRRAAPEGESGPAPRRSAPWPGGPAAPRPFPRGDWPPAAAGRDAPVIGSAAPRAAAGRGVARPGPATSAVRSGRATWGPLATWREGGGAGHVGPGEGEGPAPRGFPGAERRPRAPQRSPALAPPAPSPGARRSPSGASCLCP